MQRTPAGLPLGIPSIALLMLGAMQQAPQFGRQFMLIKYGNYFDALWASIYQACMAVIFSQVLIVHIY